MKVKKIPAYTWIEAIRNEIGLAIFRDLVKRFFDMLGDEEKKYVPLQEICKEPVTSQPKIGRNDPCPCGSGKKYKNCHGK